MKLFETLEDSTGVTSTKDGLIFTWSRKEIGFGQLTLIAKNGKLLIDDEGMSEEFCMDVIRQTFREGRIL